MKKRKYLLLTAALCLIFWNARGSEINQNNGNKKSSGQHHIKHVESDIFALHEPWMADGTPNILSRLRYLFKYNLEGWGNAIRVGVSSCQSIILAE